MANIINIAKPFDYYANKKPIGLVLRQRPIIVKTSGTSSERYDMPDTLEVVEIKTENGVEKYYTNVKCPTTGDVIIVSEEYVIKYKEI